MFDFSIFLTIIQLMCAVNFAFILSHFPNKVFKTIFDERKLFKKHFTDFIDKGSADINSLNAMEPIRTLNGGNNEGTISEVKKEYVNLINNWDKARNKISSKLNQIKGSKGVKSLFLSISLYGIIVLVFIPLLMNSKSDFWVMTCLLFNIEMILFSFWLVYYFWNHKWDQSSSASCYRKSGLIFIILFLSSFALSGINLIFVKLNAALVFNYTLVNIILSGFVWIPFIPCIISVMYVGYNEKKVKILVYNETIGLKTEQDKLHKEKESLDKMYTMLSLPVWGMDNADGEMTPSPNNSSSRKKKNNKKNS